MTLDDFHASHKYYTPHDLIAEVFEGNEDAYLEAWCAGRISRLDELPVERLQVLLLRRLVQGQREILAALT